MAEDPSPEAKSGRRAAQLLEASLEIRKALLGSGSKLRFFGVRPDEARNEAIHALAEALHLDLEAADSPKSWLEGNIWDR